MKTGYNILICPLEWGLGHAARMIPLARRLTELNHHVIIAAGEEHLSLFREEMHNVQCISFPGFRPLYSKYLPQYIPLLFEIPALFYHIVSEHLRLKKIVREYSIDIVISDNRFGLWNKKTKTVYITHMPRIPFPFPFRFLEFIGTFLHRAVIRRYDFCFIPDLPGEPNLSGRLSHGLRLPGSARYIGILSRFKADDSDDIRRNASPGFRTVILSGPEPQRTVFKERMTEILKDDGVRTVILEGKPGKGRVHVTSGNLTFFSHPDPPEMQRIIVESDCVVSRSGYTVIMELVSLNRGALLIPTPGQTEQEYLAGLMTARGWFSSVSQKSLGKENMSEGNIRVNHSEIIRMSSLLLNNALKELLE